MNGLNAVLNAKMVLKERQRDDTQIALVGEGREKPRLQAQAQKLGLYSVLFLDPVLKTKLADLKAGADVGSQLLSNAPSLYLGISPKKIL